MKNVTKTIKLLQSDTDCTFNNFSKIYPMTTENINDTYNQFDLTDKSVLTVTSSSDHLLCALVENAKEVDSFDINLFTNYFYHFKKAMIESYKLDDYKNIFTECMMEKGIIKYKWFNDFKHKIDINYQMFWDKVVNYSIQTNTPFNNLFLIKSTGLNLVNYLNPTDYAFLQYKLCDFNHNFIHSNVMKLDKHLSKKYDYIFLSNIADYEGIDCVKQISEDKLSQFLNPGGNIVYAYMYDADKKRIKQYSNNFIEIPSTTYDDTKKDYILTLNK